MTDQIILRTEILVKAYAAAKAGISECPYPFGSAASKVWHEFYLKHLNQLNREVRL